MLVWAQSTQRWHTLGGAGLESLLILKVCFKGALFHPLLFTGKYLGSERVVTYLVGTKTGLLDPEHSSNCPNTEDCLPWPCHLYLGLWELPNTSFRLRLRPTPLWDPFLCPLRS